MANAQPQRPLVDESTGLPRFVTHMIGRSWWTLAVRGVLGVLVGITALVLPAATLAAFLAFAGAYLIVDGVFTLISGFRAAHDGSRFWPFALEGALSIIVGFMAFRQPTAFAFGVLLLVALRCIVTGGAELAAGTMVKRETGTNDWALWIAGGSSVLFGLLLLISPSIGIATLVTLAGFYAIIFGVALTGSAFRLRSLLPH
jgi:uncharacterized membrane protein HdeD (DUF308 family)